MKIRIKKIKHKILVQTIALYLLLLFSSGYYFRDNHGTRALIIMMLSALVMMAYNGISISVNKKKSAQMFLLIFIFTIYSSFFNGDDIKSLLIYLIGYSTSVVITMSVAFEDFLGLYVKLMRVLIIFSLIFFIIQILRPSFYHLLPFSSVSDNGYFFLIYTAHDYGSQVRNASIFWEPGAFQTFLVLAFLFEEYLKIKKYEKYQLIIIIALLTTLSTTGIICDIGLIVFYFIKADAGRNKVLRNTLIVLTSIAIGLIAIYFFHDKIDYLVRRNLTGKIANLLARNPNAQSESVRIDSIVYPFKLFVSNPLLGTGSSGMNSISNITGHAMLTCTPINWFAKYGIIYGLFMLIGIVKIGRTLSSKTILRAIGIVTILTSIATENYIDNPMIILLCLYGYIVRYFPKENVRSSELICIRER